QPGADVSAETRATTTGDSGHRPRAPHEPRTPLARADALVAVAEAYLRAPGSTAAAGASATATPAPVELVVHVDETALLGERSDAGPHDASPASGHATLDDGTVLPLATAQRLACDASVVRVIETEPGEVRTLGRRTRRTRRTRRISATLRRALRVRDHARRFPGCTNRITDAHHVLHWARGGATRLDNLCLLCRRHHRPVHEHAYAIERAPGGELRFLRPDGSALPPAGPARAPLDGDGFARLAREHAALGLRIDAQTAFPRWDGERVDYDAVVHALASRVPRAFA
ncbi:MAG: HNH endonuclease signature motif containing protein, partial [Thermodesulfobacteriota bacterium]